MRCGSIYIPLISYFFPPFREGYEIQPPTLTFKSQPGICVNPPVDRNKWIRCLMIKTPSNNRSLKPVRNSLFRWKRVWEVQLGWPVAEMYWLKKTQRHGQIERLWGVSSGDSILAAEGGVIAWLFVIFFFRSIIKTLLSYVILFLHHLRQVQTNRQYA